MTILRLAKFLFFSTLAVSVLTAGGKDPQKMRRKIPQVIQTGKPKSVHLAPKWDPVAGRLEGTLKPLDLERGRYFKGVFDGKGRLDRVIYFDEQRKPVYEYRLSREDDGLYRKYTVRFLQDSQLSEIEPDLIAPDLSTVKKGWRAVVDLNTGFLPKRIEALDGNDILYYYYIITYPKVSNKPGEQLAVSTYYQSDSAKVGSRELRYRTGEGLIEMTIRDAAGHVLKKTELERDYNAMETKVTVLDSTGRVLERRIRPGLK